MRVNHEGEGDGTGRRRRPAASGAHEREVVDAASGLGNGNAGRARRVEEARPATVEPWSFGLGFQLPVGELQSTRSSPRGRRRLPCRRRGRRDAASREAARGGGGAAAVGRDEPRGAQRGAANADARRDRCRDGRGTRLRDEARDEPAGGSRDEPVGEAARVAGRGRGRRRGTAALSLLGAGVDARLERRAAGRPAELTAGRRHRATAPARPRATATCIPRPERCGATPDRGWVSPNLYELDRGAVGAPRSSGPRRVSARGVPRASRRRSTGTCARPRRGSAPRPRGAGRGGAGLRRSRPRSSRRASSPTSRPGRTASRPGSSGPSTAPTRGVSLLGEITGKPGQRLGRVYTVTKETVKGTSEGVAAYARGQGGALAAEGSAWVIAERAGIGLAKGGAKVGLDYAAGKVMEGAARLGGPAAPGAARPRATRRSRASFERWPRAPREGATRQAVGIAVGKTAASQRSAEARGLGGRGRHRREALSARAPRRGTRHPGRYLARKYR